MGNLNTCRYRLGNRHFAQTASDNRLSTSSLVDTLCAWHIRICRPKHYRSGNYSRDYYIFFSLKEEVKNMTDKNQEKQADDKNAINSVAAGIVGAVAIAGVAVAATIALKDQKTRDKVKKVLINAKDRAIDYVDTFKAESNPKKDGNAIRKITTSIRKAVSKKTKGKSDSAVKTN